MTTFCQSAFQKKVRFHFGGVGALIQARFLDHLGGVGSRKTRRFPFWGVGLAGGELEPKLIQTQMTQKPMLRVEVGARALRNQTGGGGGASSAACGCARGLFFISILEFI